jgi:hypothetical protein
MEVSISNSASKLMCDMNAAIHAFSAIWFMFEHLALVFFSSVMACFVSCAV